MALGTSYGLMSIVNQNYGNTIWHGNDDGRKAGLDQGYVGNQACNAAVPIPKGMNSGKGNVQIHISGERFLSVSLTFRPINLENSEHQSEFLRLMTDKSLRGRTEIFSPTG